MLAEALSKKIKGSLLVGVIQSVYTVTKKAVITLPNGVTATASYDDSIGTLEASDLVLVGRTSDMSFIVIQKAEGAIPTETTMLVV